MPPQQPDRLLDLVDDRLDFCAHNRTSRMDENCDLAIAKAGRNSGARQ
jgi:hypothetical protein